MDLRWLDDLDLGAPAGEVLGYHDRRWATDDDLEPVIPRIRFVGSCELGERQVVAELMAESPHVTRVDADRRTNLGTEFRDGGGDIAPCCGEIETVRPDRGQIGDDHRLDPADPERPRSGLGVREEIPDVAFGDQAEWMNRSLGHLLGPIPVPEIDLPAFDHGAFEGRQHLGSGAGGARTPTLDVHEHGLRCCLGIGLEGFGKRAHELAQCGLGLGGHRRGSTSDEEQRPGFIGGESAEVGPSATQQLPTAAPARLRVHREADRAQRFEVPARGLLRHFQLRGELAGGHSTPGLEQQESGDEATGTHAGNDATKTGHVLSSLSCHTAHVSSSPTTNSSASAIEAIGLTKHYGDVHALDGLDLVAPSGKVTAVLGPNGAGKTTFVRAVATLLGPDSGSLTVVGINAIRHPDQVRRVIGLAGQNAAVEPALTGRENLVMVARLFGHNRTDAAAAATAVLAEIALTDDGDRPVKEYSGGMRRRLDLGASLVGSPRMLLLDEPTTGLDPRTRLELWDSIRALVAGGTDVLLTTQYLEEADQLADHVVIIDHGRSIATGTPTELKARAGLDMVEIRVTHGSDLASVAAMLAPLGTDPPRLDEPGRRVSVPVSEGTSRLSDAVRLLSESGIELDDIGLRRPTLDEVFLTLTGQSIDPQSSTDAA